MPHPAADEASIRPLMEPVKRRNDHFSKASVFGQTIAEISALEKCYCHQTTEMSNIFHFSSLNIFFLHFLPLR